MALRIAIIFEFPTLNGGERSMLSVIDQTDRSEFEFVAVAPVDGPLADALRERQIPIEPLRIRDPTGHRLPVDEAVKSIVEAVDAVRPDLAHGNSLAIGRLLGPVKTLAGVCTVAHLRDIMKLSAKAVGDLNQNTRLLAVSEATRTFHIGQGLSASRTIVVYNGVDGDQFRPRPKNVELRRQLSVSADAIMVLTVGQIGLRKGLDVLADAAVQIVADHHRMQFVVVGERNSSKAESIEFERQFVATFEAAGVRDHLHLTGYRHDVAQLMSESDLLVHPARQEPFGRVLLEAAATGLPIVATAVGGTEEMLVDGENARFVVPDDPRALESAVVELILDVPLRHRLGAAARRHVRRCFSKSQAASDLNRVWRDVIRG